MRNPALDVPTSTGLLILASILLAAPAAGADPTASRSPLLRGRWVLDAEGRAVPPDSFRRGLQPSGLVARGGELWSVGDQRSQYPGHLFRIDPRTGRLIGKPLRLELPAERPGESPQFAIYRSIPNCDLEGLAAEPGDPDRFVAVTEDKVPWIVRIRLERTEDGSPAAARIDELAPLRFPAGLTPWRVDSNFQLEGIAISDDPKRTYLAYERADDDLPRILVVRPGARRPGAPVLLDDLAVRFSEVPRRAEKGRARLNINDISFLRHAGRAWLAAVARDQERLLLIDLEARRVARIVDLELRDPAGNRIYWVSPEGLACDVARRRLWIINDPDSVRGNYRRADEEVASGPFAEYAPLLFEMSLDSLLPPAGDRPAAGSAGS